MKQNFFNDFKITFLGLSFLAFLLAFVIAGMLSTYWYLHTIPQAEFNNLNVVFTRINTSAGWEFIGLVFDNQGNPISNAKVTVIYPNSTKIYYTNSSGYFSFYGEIPKKIIVTYDGQQKSILITYCTCSEILPNGTVENVTNYNFPYVNISYFYNYLGCCGLIIGYNGHIAKAITLSSNVTFYFFKTYVPINGSLLNIKILQPLKIVTITIPKGTLAVVDKHCWWNRYSSGCFAFGSYFATVPPIEIKFLKHEGVITFPIFSLVLGTAFIYINYRKFKEKSSQMSRGLYLTSYFSSILALAISTLIFSLATSLVFFTYTGIFPAYDIVGLFAFIFLSVIIWYSLSYFLFSKFSPAAGLALSIFLLIVFLLPSAFLLIQIIPIKPLYYFLPTSLAYLILYHSIYFSYPINPEISLATEVLWIIIPTVTGYLVSKKG